MDINKPNEEQTRKERADFLISQGVELYPSKCDCVNKANEAKEAEDGSQVKVCGRLIGKRNMGKLTFGHIKDFTAKLQIAFSKEELGDEKYKFLVKNFDIGDFVQVEGKMFTTHKGERSIMVKDAIMLSKALLPLPEKWHGLSDTESRYRQKYLDLLANESAMEIAKLRSNLVKEIREYFNSKDFYEVETPVLQPLYGGALAKPFSTRHNALDTELYLRIAPELYLKRLIVGGFEKVYEIAKCFRNEGIDNNHNPEFTQIEFYWAYADYNDLMNLIEDFLPKLIKSVGLPLKFKAGEQEVDFTPPYPRKTMRDLIKEYTKIDIEDYPDQESIYKKAEELKVGDMDKSFGRGKIIDEIYKTYARPKIVNPLFIIDHPVELSPLAKNKKDDPRYVERMQLLCVGGNELCNGFSELNDPIEQERRFKEQERLQQGGDDESMPYDQDFITALKHGMPPTAGLGMGIDRLVKLLTNSDNLKEVILFPTLKPRGQEED